MFVISSRWENIWFWENDVGYLWIGKVSKIQIGDSLPHTIYRMIRRSSILLEEPVNHERSLVVHGQHFLKFTKMFLWSEISLGKFSWSNCSSYVLDNSKTLSVLRKRLKIIFTENNSIGCYTRMMTAMNIAW